MIKELNFLSVPFRKEPLEVDGHSSELGFSVKHFFLLIFSSILNAYLPLRCSVQTAWLSLTTEAHYRENNLVHKA
ncbi:hypothetical protein VISP3789_15257 [Vibrio splendidus ATCC 33789]|nr:hypothetical protein VISP3789_15257 [Vibrio splendidus ATCC 33789]